MTSSVGRPSIFWWLLSLVLTWRRHGSLELLMRPQNTLLELGELHSELQVILARPKTEAALGQGVIIPLSKPLAALQESRSQEKSNLCGTLRSTCGALPHKSDWTLAWKADVIIRDNQPFTVSTVAGGGSQRGNERCGEGAVVPTAAGL